MNPAIYHYALVIGLPLLAIIFYKFILRVFLGMVIVPENSIGLVTKKFVLFGTAVLPQGRIIATRGEAGFQAQTLAPGLYFFMWVWQYSVDFKQFTIIPSGKIGLILSRDGAILETGRVLARKVECDNFQDAVAFLNNKGRKGKQTAILTPGSYRINTLLFEVSTTDAIVIDDNKVGIVTTEEGEPLMKDQIAGGIVAGHNNFQDIDAFLEKGGSKGLQEQVILAGTFFLNPWFVNVATIPMTEIPIGYAGVVISFVGVEAADTSGLDFQHGNIYPKGSKGVWSEPYFPGKYPINTFTMKIELVPTTNIVLNWATARNESHKLDEKLSTITVRSRDGFPFNLDVSQIIHIPALEAPKVIARFGNMANLVSQVLEPTIGNYFRNSAQGSDVIAFLAERTQRQQQAKGFIEEVLKQYNVKAVDTLIGDITPPAELMKTLTDRKIASEQKTTYDTQRQAQEIRQTLEKQTAIADMQKDVVRADQGVMIAERIADATVKKATGDAEGVKIAANAENERIKKVAEARAYETQQTGDAEAGKILAIGKSNAESYKLSVDSMGQDNFTQMKIMDKIAEDKVKIMPDVLIGGGGNGSGDAISGLLGLELLNRIADKVRHKPNGEQDKN